MGSRSASALLLVQMVVIAGVASCFYWDGYTTMVLEDGRRSAEGDRPVPRLAGDREINQHSRM
jgi:hypothetical protein